MSDARDVRLNQIIEAIELYLFEHPTAADSELGITEWWLSESGMVATIDEVKEALSCLIAEGVIERVVLSDGRCIWRAVGSQR